jgi:hypothetical protein
MFKNTIYENKNEQIYNQLNYSIKTGATYDLGLFSAYNNGI